MTNFKKPPLTAAEKEKKAENFINFVEEKIKPVAEKVEELPTFKKEAVKSILLRMPESFKHDIHAIMSMTGLSFNAVCLELLRPSIKKKLKELRED